ncbi:MAG: class I SAM-dependent methyltransferase [Thaumarchaeota archaeon]|nr:class I SAM-dependent methyltransferase [Nitrososphaerota archaeon]
MREDPEQIEIRKIAKHAPFEQRDILEVGCGNGRLTFQYAESARSATALDPSAKAIAEARKEAPKKLASKLRFRVGRGEDLNYPDESFDAVFFSWSLCCADVPAMGTALTEAHRVLRPKGVLVNIQPSLHQPFNKGMISYLLQRYSGPNVSDEGDRQARLALRHASLVEGKFDLVAEEEFPVYSYYRSVREALDDVTSQNGVEYKSLDGGTARRIRKILVSMKTKAGIKVQENAVLTVLRKSPS